MGTFAAVKHYLLTQKASRFVLKTARNLFLPIRMNDVLAKTVGIEASSVCNAQCIFCPYRFHYRKRRIMSLDDFKKIAEICIKFGYENLDLTSMSGELFVHPDAVQIIRVAKVVGFKHVGTYTNAIALWRHDIADLLLSGIDAILISFPGFQPGIFKEIFQVKDFEDFRKSITVLLETHKRLNSKMQIVFEPRTYLTKTQIEGDEFYHEVISRYIGEFVHMREPLRVFDRWGGEITQDDLTGGLRLDINPVKSIYPIKKTFLCNRLAILGVLADGSVRMCNCRYDSSIETGNDSLRIDNIHNYSDLDELVRLNHDKISKILADFIKGKLPDLCKKCSFYMPTMMSTGGAFNYIAHGKISGVQKLSH